MEQIVFARFSNARKAIAGLRALRRRMGFAVSVVAHTSPTEDRGIDQMVQHSTEFGESDLRHALMIGVIGGALTGAVTGGVLSWLEIFPRGIVTAVWIGTLMGVIAGLIAMTLVGSGMPDWRLQRLARGAGSEDVIVTVRLPSAEDQAEARRILDAAGGTAVEKQ